MKRFTVMIIPDGGRSTRQVRINGLFLRIAALSLAGMAACAGYFTLDYLQLRKQRARYQTVSTENEGLKGEARILMDNLDNVKKSLRRVQDYTAKLSEISTLKVSKISKKTGIGPLSPEEYSSAPPIVSPDQTEPGTYIPTGLRLDKLVFRPVFDRLNSLENDANRHAIELQQLLSNLSQQKSLLSSVPTVAPVDGWITSGFGKRISPFTGDRSFHHGVDIAAQVGTPIYAPADGVVIFTGAKEGFGNFIMIAHGYGIVTRYGHNHQNMVQPGQTVVRGEQIGTVGMSGRTTGPHLHYEVVLSGKNENPNKFILNMDEFIAH